MQMVVSDRTDLPARIQALRRLPLFRTASGPALAPLAESGARQCYAAGARLATSLQRVYLIERGLLRVYRLGPQGQQVTLLYLPDGACLGLVGRDEEGRPKSAVEAVAGGAWCTRSRGSTSARWWPRARRWRWRCSTPARA